MYLELEDNALDSLKYGVDYYQKFLSLDDKYYDGNPTYLKMALIMIHEAIELFIKKVLCNINELLIYDDISSEKLLYIYSYKINNEKDIPLDYYMTGEEYSIHTINYKTLIKRFKILCNLDEKQHMNLQWLGEYRNKVSHFGIDMRIDYYKILTVLNSALDILTGVVYNKLLPDKKGLIILDTIYDKILDVLEVGEIEEKDAWTTYYSDNFMDVNFYISKLAEDENFKRLLIENNYEIQIKQNEYIDLPFKELNLINKDESKSEYIRICNDVFLDATLFIGETIDGPIYFILDQQGYLIDIDNSKCFYVYYKPTFIENYEEKQIRFWEEDRKSNLCYRVEFNYDQLIRGLHKILKL